ncbi:MAG: DUF4149 domain-containing protein [Verrucomicrobiae bacterium]|nr:DUF4149 domain-containing protein [Verrucomicrobiae bacterium]
MTMKCLWNQLLLWSSSLLLGGTVYFSFLMAPVLFRAFGREEAGKITTVLFDNYYLLALACGSVLLGCGLTALRPLTLPRAAVLTGLALLILLCTAVAQFGLRPAMQEVRHTDPPRFRALHGMSMVLNLLVMLSAGTTVAMAPGWIRNPKAAQHP